MALLQRNMTQAALTEAAIPWVHEGAADHVIAKFNDSHRKLIAVDGFMGSGKSPFASMLEYRLRRECVRIDKYVKSAGVDDQQSPFARIDFDRLRNDLQIALAAGSTLIEGVFALKILEALGLMSRDKIFHVYVAGAWKPDATRVSWPDAAQLESNNFGPLTRAIAEYHVEYKPHESFDALVLRNQNEPAETGSFVAPSGDIFVVKESVWPKAERDQLRINSFAYLCSDADATMEPIGLIELSSVLRKELDSNRFYCVLHAFHAHRPVAPVTVQYDEATGQRLLLEGLHRFFGSIAVGMCYLPSRRVSKTNAETISSSLGR